MKAALSHTSWRHYLFVYLFIYFFILTISSCTHNLFFLFLFILGFVLVLFARSGGLGVATLFLVLILFCNSKFRSDTAADCQGCSVVFSFFQSPAITDFYPTKGPSSGGTLLTVYGTNLDAGHNVQVLLLLVGIVYLELSCVLLRCVSCTNKE